MYWGNFVFILFSARVKQSANPLSNYLDVDIFVDRLEDANTFEYLALKNAVLWRN